MNPQVISVREFVAILNETLSFAYPSVTIEGEVRSYKVNQGKWVFFDLADEEATLPIFMPIFQLKVPLEDGMKVRVTGVPKLTKWGKFSLTARTVELAGEGELRRAFELLKERLGAEGLFSAERKRALPRFPQSIGLITSGTSAAYADFVKILSGRWGGVRVMLADVQVQGAPAPDQIIGALEYFNQLASPVDVVVLIRGGGSLEDLQAFNNEAVARAVASSRSPIVAGVGHEIDQSLADMAADVRAATPTDAAVLVVPDRAEVLAGLIASVRDMNGSLIRRIQTIDQQLERYFGLARRVVSEPGDRIGALEQRLARSIGYLTAQSGQQLASTVRLLSGFDPGATLRRGYAIVRRSNAVVKAPNQVGAGDRLMIQLAKGIIEADAR